MREVPKVMQVKNFGKSGQTKWTNLRDADTSRRDDPWFAAGTGHLRQMGGMHHLKKQAGQSARSQKQQQRENEENGSSKRR